MGVLRYFRWLLNKYGDFYIPLKSKGRNKFYHYPDMLCIDCNAIFHPCFREIFCPEVKRLLKPTTSISYEEKVEQAIQLIIKKIETITAIMKPKKCLYLAIDGVAGCCKQSQQRKRRFKSVKDLKEAGMDKNVDFDFTALTAGTELIKQIGHRLKEYYESNKKNITVVINDVHIVGEGEHKLIRCINKEKIFKSFCIFSPDADLIMLSLTIDKRFITVLRENIYDDIDADFLLVNIDILKARMIEDLSIKQNNFNSGNNIIVDAVLFLFMLGNDFLPNVNAIDIAYDGIDILYTYYNECKSKHGYLLNQEYQLNQKSLCELFKILSEAEPGLLLKKKKSSRAKYPDTLLNTNCSGDVIDFKTYREMYYKRNFGEVEIEKICEEYIKGLHFVMQYYAIEIPTYDWYYPYHYAPLFYDLYEYTKNNDCQFTWKFKKPLSLTEALVSVLPPESFYLLPPQVGTFMINQALIDDDFPTEFTVDYEGKINDYEGVCLLPMITYEKVKGLCRKFKCKDEEGRLTVI